jgi:hypothetical protein
VQDDLSELDRLQEAYKEAVEEWVSAIRREEALVSVNHTVAEVLRLLERLRPAINQIAWG